MNNNKTTGTNSLLTILIFGFFLLIIYSMIIRPAFGLFLFLTPFIFLFVLCPFFSIFIENESTKNKIYIVIFILRYIIYKIFEFMFGIEFVLVFVFAFAINPLLCLIFKKDYQKVLNSYPSFLNKLTTQSPTNIVVQNPVKETPTVVTPNTSTKNFIRPTNFDNMYILPEEGMLEEFIKRELVKAGVDLNAQLIPSSVLKKKKIFSVLFNILLFIYMSLIFFHFPIYTYIIGILIIVIFNYVTQKYNIIQYIKKEIKARPSEKISNIVMNIHNTLVPNKKEVTFTIISIIAVISPLMIFSKPHIIYEKVDNGYAVRFYTFGVTNFTKVTIPEAYKNEDVVSLRGNTFSNMPFLISVKLPDTITEIRGQAFKNCKRLTQVNIPSKLEYLGGGAFYNAKAIKNIELPDTLTTLGGESFYGAESLESVKLSENLTEIRGDSFEYCTSLKSIKIPDKVERIGGHAFYGDTSLEEVTISENSHLKEIGSSAFRRCLSLKTISIPNDTIVNERAFKESPTIVKRYNYYEETANGDSSPASNNNRIDNNDDESFEIVSTNEDNYIIPENTNVNFNRCDITANTREKDGKKILKVKSEYGVTYTMVFDETYYFFQNNCEIDFRNYIDNKTYVEVRSIKELSNYYKNKIELSLDKNESYRINENAIITCLDKYEYQMSNDNGEILEQQIITKREGIFIFDNDIMLEMIDDTENIAKIKIYYN